MKIVSWNVNGLRAEINTDFNEVFNNMNADIFCIQETKLQEGQIKLNLDGYHQYWNYADRKGYSGTATFTKEEPIDVIYGINNEDYDNEGRVITLEYKDFYVVNVYVPNSQMNLTRLNYRLEFGDYFNEFLKDLSYIKPVIVCGDFNVIHTELDVMYPEKCRNKEGFTYEERGQFDELLDNGFCDIYRKMNPKIKAYTWYSNNKMFDNSKRIDYFLVSNSIAPNVYNTQIRQDIGGKKVDLDLILYQIKSKEDLTIAR